MKICVLGLTGADGGAIFADERLLNIRRLMDFGVYGRLRSVVPATAIPSWMCMATSQDPGSLGVYGPRDRVEYSYDQVSEASSASLTAPTIWDEVAREGKKAIIMSVPPGYPLRHVKGISVGSFLTPGEGDFADPPTIKARITELVGEVPVKVESSEGILSASETQWQVARWLLSEQEWDYFQFVDGALDRLAPNQDAISDYYLFLDEQVGAVLELIDDETILLVLSDHAISTGDPSFDIFDINDWLVRDGLLALNTPRAAGVPFEQQSVNWSVTKAWSEGDQIFFNVQDREPKGVVRPNDIESLQTEIKTLIKAQNAVAFNPAEIYRNTRNVAPDLVVQHGNSSQGLFILTAPNSPLNGEYEGASLLDMAPTLLDLAGYKIPETMQGRSLVAGIDKKSPGGPQSDQMIRDRLAGLGYI